MNFNASNPRQPYKLGTKRIPQDVNISNTGQNFPPPYNYYDNSVPSPQQPQYDPFQPNAPPPPSYGPPLGAPNYGQPPSDSGFSVPGQYLANPLVANAAMHYGQQIMGSGKEYMDKEFQKYVPVSKLKYYFAVDTAYVAKKLKIIFFPFLNKDWSIRYSPEEPIQPRYDVNAPDLYIPTMAYLTYVLVAGFTLGTQNRFTPEMLGIQASSALAWTILEVLIYFVSLYAMNLKTSLTLLDILAYSGYKYVGIIVAVLCSLVFQKTGYYITLLYCGLALFVFLLRTLKCKILERHEDRGDPYSPQSGNKRRLYLLITMSGFQPVIMWWLSYHLIAAAVVPVADSLSGSS